MNRFLTLIFPIILLLGCVDSLDEYNIDDKNATKVAAETLFSNSFKRLTDVITTPNVNTNNFRLYVQHWTTTTYLDEPRYNLTARSIPYSIWSWVYKDVLADLNESKRIINENKDVSFTQASRNNQLAQIGIVEVYAWSILINTFGDIPYTEALNINNPLPKYDDAKTIYSDLLVRLDASLKLLNTDGDGFTNGDLLYQGNISSWIKFGNSLKLKLAMIISDVDDAKAKSLIAEAAPNVFTSNGDKATFPYQEASPNYNPVAENINLLFTKRQDFVGASTLIDPLNKLNDPRLPVYFTSINGKYVGGIYGFSNTYTSFSHIGDKVIEPTLEGMLMDYSEVEFFLAEAVERGFITGNAEEHYNKAITASILYWGGTAAEADDYLKQPAVAYTSAEGNFKQKIGFQKWLALYNRGWESWVEWRRLDFPKLSPPTGGNAPEGLAIPVRIIYPITEHTENPANWNAASTTMGGDLASKKLWWDKY